MDWAVLLTALVLLVIGVALLFAGYRLFRLLIPIWGFIVGFDIAVAVGRAALNAQPLSTVTGWIIAIVVGLLFAALAYAYYYVSVVVLGASVGFVLGEALATTALSGNGVLIAGIIGAILVAVIVIALDLPKALIVVLTALGGATAAVAGVLLLFGRISLGMVQAGATGGATDVIRSSWWLSLLTLALALVGILVQAGRLRQAPYTHAYALRPGARRWPPNRFVRTSRTTSASYSDRSSGAPPATPVV